MNKNQNYKVHTNITHKILTKIIFFYIVINLKEIQIEQRYWNLGDGNGKVNYNINNIYSQIFIPSFSKCTLSYCEFWDSSNRFSYIVKLIQIISSK